MAITLVGIAASGMGDYNGGALSCDVPVGTINGDDIWLCDAFFVSAAGTVTYDLTTYDIGSDFESGGGGHFGEGSATYAALNISHRVADNEPDTYDWAFNAFTNTDARRAYFIVVTRYTGSGFTYTKVADSPFNVAGPFTLTPSGATEMGFVLAHGYSSAVPIPTVSLDVADVEATAFDPLDIGTIHRFRLGVNIPTVEVVASFVNSLGGQAEHAGIIGVDIATPGAEPAIESQSVSYKLTTRRVKLNELPYNIHSNMLGSPLLDNRTR